MAVLGAGVSFGEAALMSEEPRNAYVRAAEDCELFVVSKVLPPPPATHGLQISQISPGDPRTACVCVCSLGRRVCTLRWRSLRRSAMPWRRCGSHLYRITWKGSLGIQS